MNEQSKIDEAIYFLTGIQRAVDDQQATRYEVSAFLSATRSVLQYALKEAAGKAGGQRWYDQIIKVDSVVDFLKDSRDINVHERPVPMLTHTTFHVGTAAMSISSSSATPLAPPEPPAPRSYRYEFKGWSGPEGVAALCARYLNEVTRIVADGQAQGFLTR
jgi:hypothetical protein